MSFEIKPMQHLLLWHLAVDRGGDFLGNIKKIGTAPQRNALAKIGLILEEQHINPDAKTKRKVKFFSLTEKGWAWCQDNMAWPNNASSPQAGKVLGLLLPRLRLTFERREPIASLGEFINKSTTTIEAFPEPKVLQAIRDACKSLGNGKEGVRLRIADVRNRVNGFSKEEVTEAFWDLCKKGELSLYHMDDPREIQPEDRESAVKTSTGEEKHIVWFGGKAS